VLFWSSCAIILFEKLDDDDDDDDNHQNKFYDDDNFNNFQIRLKNCIGRKTERKKESLCLCLFVSFFLLWAWQAEIRTRWWLHLCGRRKPTLRNGVKLSIPTTAEFLIGPPQA
jgi:hypothetical protein